MKKPLILVLAVLAIIGGLFLIKSFSTTGVTPVVPLIPTNNQNQSLPQDTSVSSPKKSGFTLSDVAAHMNATSCWTAIDGNVYDLTSWISEHPGGEKGILSICGKDGSVAFNGQHGGQAKTEMKLDTFLIGPLVQ